MIKWERGIWNDGRKDCDVLWMPDGSRELGYPPWVFIQNEDDSYVYGIGYGEGGYEWTIPKHEVL